MKNKKLKIFVIIILILQILLPAGLLGYHYSLHARAMKESPDFKLRVSYMNIWDYVNDGELLHFELDNIYLYYGEDITVTMGTDSVATLSRAENKRLNKHWFSFDYYRKLGSYHADEGEFTYVDTPEANAVMDKWRNNPHNDLGEVLDYQGGNSMYITAKIYKGLIIPTAVYNLDVKIIDLTKSK